MRDWPGVEAGGDQLLLNLLTRRAFVALGETDRQRRTGARTAESEQLAAFGCAERLLHRLDVGRADAADDRHIPVGDTGGCGGILDVTGERLPGLLAVGSVVDQHGNALFRQPGDLVRRELTAHHHLVVELTDHDLTLAAPSSAEPPEPVQVPERASAPASERRPEPPAPLRRPRRSARNNQGTAGCS